MLKTLMQPLNNKEYLISQKEIKQNDQNYPINPNEEKNEQKKLRTVRKTEYK